LDLELMEYPKANKMLETKFFRRGIGQGYQPVAHSEITATFKKKTYFKS